MYSYSTDGEYFKGEFATPEAAALNAFNQDLYIDVVEVAENKRVKTDFYVCAYEVIGCIQQRARDECGETAAGWLEGLTRDQEKVSELKKIIVDWIEANDPPKFYRLGDAMTIKRSEMVIALERANKYQKVIGGL